MGDVIQFRDTSLPLSGEARDAAMAVFREEAARIVPHWVGAGLTTIARSHNLGQLSLEDAYPLIVEARQDDLSKMHW